MPRIRYVLALFLALLLAAGPSAGAYAAEDNATDTSPAISTTVPSASDETPSEELDTSGPTPVVPETVKEDPQDKLPQKSSLPSQDDSEPAGEVETVPTPEEEAPSVEPEGSYSAAADKCDTPDRNSPPSGTVVTTVTNQGSVPLVNVTSQLIADAGFAQASHAYGTVLPGATANYTYTGADFEQAPYTVVFKVNNAEVSRKGPIRIVQCATPEPEPETKTMSWKLPPGTTPQTQPQAAQFPQTPGSSRGESCEGAWYQVDVYKYSTPEEKAKVDSLDDDGVLTYGEDSSVYISATFVEEKANPELCEVPPGQPDGSYDAYADSCDDLDADAPTGSIVTTVTNDGDTALSDVTSRLLNFEGNEVATYDYGDVASGESVDYTYTGLDFIQSPFAVEFLVDGKVVDSVEDIFVDPCDIELEPGEAEVTTACQTLDFFSKEDASGLVLIGDFNEPDADEAKSVSPNGSVRFKTERSVVDVFAVFDNGRFVEFENVPVEQKCGNTPPKPDKPGKPEGPKWPKPHKPTPGHIVPTGVPSTGGPGASDSTPWQPFAALTLLALTGLAVRRSYTA